MSALLTSLSRCCRRSVPQLVARRRWSPSTTSPPPPPSPAAPTLYRRLLLYLTQRFYDVEMMLLLRKKLSTKQLKKKNAYYSYTQGFYGQDLASAYYVLSLKGAFRYVGHSQWFRSDSRGRFNWGFLEHKDTPLEEVDMSHTIINYIGLDNLDRQKSLRTLRLRGCPEVDDWFLARLHIFQDTLEELDISHCQRITAGGLAALQHLRKLKRLDVSSLPRIKNPGLVIILLEEMLPECQVTATGYDFSLSQAGEEGEEEEKEGEELLRRRR